MSTDRRIPRERGFTFIELMTVIAIAAVLLFVATPSFVTFQRNSELTSATNSLVGAMNAARGEAMKRGMSAMVIPNTGTDWDSGWTVFVDSDRSNNYDANTDITIYKQDPLPTYFTTTGKTGSGDAVEYVMFDPSGYSKTVGSAAFQSLTMSLARNDLSANDKAEQTRILVVAVTGRIRACRPSTDTTCVSTATE
ncbi:GspH/FimT family pseudopilin [Variovorax saccharolyticus]|uniref:GspH/FimT family pseudopilin n=1 Tax=Variovorax saccharolyticus TaxID=3053516 RepID=UPI002577C16D|nr:GspH/FimT family pseudopilin [Variovorax sp. J22R187]MDM0019955.1 GspH/FimT family pseudopilin [Variovorax sp. J22R187]